MGKKKVNLKEASLSAEYLHIFNDLLDPDRISHIAKHADVIKRTIMLVVGSNIAAKFLADKIYNLLNKAKKPGAVKPEEVEKVKDEIENAYNKAPEEKKDAFDKQMQTIEKQVEKEIAEAKK